MKENYILCNKKIDIHAHVTSFNEWGKAPWYKRLTPEELQDKYKEMGVEKGLILPIVSPDAQMLLDTNESIYKVVKEYPESFYFGINFDPKMGKNNAQSDFGEMMEFLKGKGAKSVGELTANFNIDDERYDNLFAQCAEHNLPVTIHLSPSVGFYYGMVDDLGLPRLEKLLKKYPKLKVFGHSQMFWAHISKNVCYDDLNGYPTGKIIPGRIEEMMEKYDNLYCDLSANSGYNALSRDEEYTSKFVEKFGLRIMFGLDICSLGDNRPLPQYLDKLLIDGVISQENYNNICRENAIRILGL